MLQLLVAVAPRALVATCYDPMWDLENVASVLHILQYVLLFVLRYIMWSKAVRSAWRVPTKVAT